MQQTPPPEEPVVMRPPWWALPVTAVGCLAFVAMGAALVAVGDAPGTAIGIVSVAFFGGGLVVLVLRRPWRWAIVIDDRGVTRRRPGRDTLVRWDNIAGIRYRKGGRLGGGVVVLTLLDPAALDHPALGPLNGPLQAFNRAATGGGAVIARDARDRPPAEGSPPPARRPGAWDGAKAG